MNLSNVKKILFNKLSGKQNNKWDEKLDLLLELELAKAIKDDTPVSEYLSITRMQEKLNSFKSDEKVIEALYSMYTSDGWKYFTGYLRALQIFIEKKLAADMTMNEKDEVASRVEHSVYTKIISNELLTRERYKGIMETRANQKLNENKE